MKKDRQAHMLIKSKADAEALGINRGSYDNPEPGTLADLASGSMLKRIPGKVKITKLGKDSPYKKK